MSTIQFVMSETIRDTVKIVTTPRYFLNYAQVTSRKSEQEFVRSLSSFVRPNAHRYGGDEAQKNTGEPFVQLIEVCEVGTEEVIRAEGGGSASDEECTKKDITTGASEVGSEITFEYSDNCL